MEKRSIQKAMKFGFCFIGVGFMALVIWANWNGETFTQKHVADSRYITIDISKSKNETNRLKLEEEISSIDGVSSCSVNLINKTAGIIFYTSNLSSESLQSNITKLVGFPVSEKMIVQQSGGCPVSGVKYFVLHIRDMFRFRS